jgi:tripartite-type tricarboxylate transporter receptor subunit TctC
MKYLISLFLALILCGNANALPDKITVYLSSGARNTVCRNLFTIYARQYNADITFITKVGIGGVLAMTEMYRDPNFAVLCSGLSESVFNNAQYPGYEKEHAALTQVVMIADGQTSFYTRTNSKYNNILDIIKECKPVMVGINLATVQIITDAMFGDCPVTYVSFKGPGDALASLMDGSVDFYVESSFLESIVKSGKLKSIGRINPTASMAGPDVTKYFPHLAALRRFTSIATSNLNKKDDIEELNKRLRPIVISDEFYPSIENMGTVMNTSVDEANAVVTSARDLVNKLGKKSVR